MGESENTLSPIQPYVVVAVLCDTIITEAETNKKTLVGLFDKVFSPGFPVVQRFGIYVKLTDAQGLYQLRLDYVKRDTNTVIESIEIGGIQIDDRLGSSDVVFSIATGIPDNGAYEFRLYANGSFLTHVDFSAELLAPTEDNPS